MKDIIIVGTGKAALLHYNSYRKLKNKGVVIDKENNCLYIDL